MQYLLLIYRNEAESSDGFRLGDQGGPSSGIGSGIREAGSIGSGIDTAHLPVRWVLR